MMDKHIQLANEEWLESIFSDGTSRFISNSNPKLGDTIEIKLKTWKEAPITCIYLRYLKNGEETIVQMNNVEEKGKFKFYNANICIKQPVINYHFIILTNDNVYFYNQLGVFNYNIAEEYDFKLLADFKDPEWVRDSIFYQIFVDRFNNGDYSNDPKDDEYSYNGYKSKRINWGVKPGEYEEYGNLDFFGGDLKGIEKKIGYLKSLGINALYLNPIFDAPSNHKYDCSDFYNVDKHFGGNEALTELVNKLHQEGIKVILDISINHTGDTNGWLKEKKEYYHIKDDGDLECWNGVKSLPTLNYSNEELRNTIYRNQDSVLKFWLKKPFNIDGWRLDVGHNVGKMNSIQVDQQVWTEVRKEIKEVNNEAYIMAEHWTDCSKYLQGDIWDGTMNYFGFFRPTRRYLGEPDHFIRWKIRDFKMEFGNAEVFKNEVLNHYGKLPYKLQGLQLNLLGSHDVHRIHNSPYIDEKNVITSIIMLFTFLGTPCVYYGDEVGLDGEFDTGQGPRYPMEWNEDKWNKKINRVYKEMLALRKSDELLKDGSFKILMAEGKVLSYARFNEKEAIIFINSQYEDEININVSLESIGDIKNIESIYGHDCTPSIEHGGIHCLLKAKDTILLKAYFK